MRGRLFNVQTVDTRRALVGPDPLPRALQVASRKGALQQPLPALSESPCGRNASSLTERFTVSPFPRLRPPRVWRASDFRSCRIKMAYDALSRSAGGAEPFVDKKRLLRPLLTSRSDRRRRPFRHEAKSPQVRTQSFTAQPPDLRRLPLTTRASRFLARSPWLASPCIRFLFIGSRLRSTLPPHTRSPLCSCASLRSLWSTHGGTLTHKIAPMLGAPKKDPPKRV